MKKWIIFLFSVWMLVFCGVQVTNAATYYVDKTTGNDGDTGLSGELAFETIAKVNSLSLDPDDNILFKKGEEWHEKLIPPSSGTSGHPITFSSYGDGVKPIINGGGTRDSGINSVSKSYFVIDGFIVKNFDKSIGSVALYFRSGTNITVQNCDISEVYYATNPNPGNSDWEQLRGSGIMFHSVPIFDINNNTIRDVGYTGIDASPIYGGGITSGVIHHNEITNFNIGINIAIGGNGTAHVENIKIYNNYIHDFDNYYVCGAWHRDGIHIYDAGSAYTVKDVEIYNNYFEDNTSGPGGTSWIYAQWVEGFDIHHNIIRDGGSDFAINVRGGDDYEIYNNTFYNRAIIIRESSSNVKIKNNIFKTTGSAYTVSDVSSLTGFESDYNILDTGSVAANGPTFYYATFAELQAAGYDLNSINDDPLFSGDPDVSDLETVFTLQADSPAIDAGLDLGFLSDYAGTSIPQPGGGDRDYGVYEFVQGAGGEQTIAYFTYDGSSVGTLQDTLDVADGYDVINLETEVEEAITFTGVGQWIIGNGVGAIISGLKTITFTDSVGSDNSITAHATLSDDLWFHYFTTDQSYEDKVDLLSDGANHADDAVANPGWTVGKQDSAFNSNGTSSFLGATSPNIGARTLFHTGGTFAAWLSPTDGEEDVGVVFEMQSTYNINTATADGDSVAIHLVVFFSDNNGVWESHNVCVNDETILGVITYDGSSVDNDPIIYVNDVVIPITETSTPAGTIDTPGSPQLRIASVSGTYTVGGWLDEMGGWKRIITESERGDLYNSNDGIPYTNGEGGDADIHYIVLAGNEQNLTKVYKDGIRLIDEEASYAGMVADGDWYISAANDTLYVWLDDNPDDYTWKINGYSIGISDAGYDSVRVAKVVFIQQNDAGIEYTGDDGTIYNVTMKDVKLAVRLAGANAIMKNLAIIVADSSIFNAGDANDVDYNARQTYDHYNGDGANDLTDAPTGVNDDYTLVAGSNYINAGEDTGYGNDIGVDQFTEVLTIVAPNGGEDWIPGDTENIIWLATGVDSISIRYSTDNAGVLWYWINISVDATDLIYAWVIPETVSDECIVQITEIGGDTTNDQSDAVFSITHEWATLSSIPQAAVYRVMGILLSGIRRIMGVR